MAGFVTVLQRLLYRLPEGMDLTGFGKAMKLDW
jgi:hypothetical protein